MRMIIKSLTFVVVIFAGYTVWNDPQLGPQVKAMIPKGVMDKMPVIAGNSTGGTPQATGRYGGIGAANSVAGSVVGSVSN